MIGAALARELVRREPTAALWGLGSQNMREAGVELLTDSATYGAIGIVEALAVAPRILIQSMQVVKRTLRSRRPDVVVLIDFGFFNIRVARFAKSIGLKVVYYFPPGAWRRDSAANPELARVTDLVATPFSWSLDRLREAGANAHYVGHPLLERIQPTMTRAEFCAQFGMDPASPVIGLLPGSRRHEVVHIMPLLLQAARCIYKSLPDSQFIVGVAPGMSQEMMAGFLKGNDEFLGKINDIWHEFAQEAETRVVKRVTRTARNLGHAGQRVVTTSGVVLPLEALRSGPAQDAERAIDRRSSRRLPPTVLAKGVTTEIMAHSNVLLTCSGTATLEAAVLQTPMVVVYRGSALMGLEYTLRGLRKKIPNIALPNILARARIVPELIQQDATPTAVADCAIELLNNVEARARARQALGEVRDMLGSPGATQRTASLVLAVARGESPQEVASEQQ